MTTRHEPELRFPEFSGDWEIVELNNCIKYKRNYNFSRATEGEGKYKHIHYGDIHTKLPTLITSTEIIPNIKTAEELTVLEFGDVLVADASEDYKDLGKTVVVNFNDSNVVAGLHVHAFVLSNTIHPVFYGYYTKTSQYNKYMRMYGTGVSVLGLSKKNLSRIKINAPMANEQHKIGTLFSLLDKRIEKQKEKIEQLKQLKKGLMQKIFSQEIRFKDEEGNEYPEWRQVRLSEIAKIKMGSSPKSTYYTDDRSEMILIQGNADLKNGLVYPRVYTKKAIQIAKKGAIILTVRAPVGKLAICQYDDVCIGRGVCAITADNSKFIYYLLKFFQMNNGWNRLSQGSTFESVNSNDIKQLLLHIPIREEQLKITTMLTNMDRKIDLDTLKLDKLNETKNGYLQKMFI